VKAAAAGELAKCKHNRSDETRVAVKQQKIIHFSMAMGDRRHVHREIRAEFVS
jgi:hypothetical protein